MAKIAVAGSMNMDVVIRVPHIPVPGETIIARSMSLHEGGKGANQAVAAARLGGEVHMIGRLGKDKYGETLHQSLIQSGVHTDGIEFDDLVPSGTAYINVSDNGENNIVVLQGANSRLDKEQIDKSETLLDHAAFCLVQMEIPLETVEHVVHVCKKKKVKVLLNPAPAQYLNKEVYSGLYMLIPNESELHILCPGSESLEAKARKLYEYGVENVIVTLGEQGSMLVNKDGIHYFPAYSIHVVDTTAAGDSFIGGLAVGLSENMELEQAIRFATVVAGITVSREGAQSSLPDRQCIDSLLDLK